MDDGQIAAQYSSGTLEHNILAALRQMGKNLDALAVTDLAPVDQFHSGGRAVTLGLARLAGCRPEMEILDVGGGLGGAARTLASEFGCSVTVLDLTEEFCRVGAMLTRTVGLSDRVTFRQGNALAMPFEAGSFDAVWTQHSTMNIEDKEGLFREIHRVLRPGGSYALQEVMAGPVQPLYYPVPWARNPSVSFLCRPEEYQHLLGSLGFRQIVWRDIPAAQLSPNAVPDASQQSVPLGVHVLTPDMRERLRNSARNRDEGRTMVAQAVYGRG